VSAHAYVPIAGGTRCSIGIFSYLNTMTFGINADFDGFPDVDVLSGGIRRGIEQLLALAKKKSEKVVQAEAAADAVQESEPAPKPAPTAPAAKKAPAKRAAAKQAPAKKAAAKSSGPAKKTATAAR
jgi:diacylglycerol O-acyltransferase / wax synthase